MRKPELRGPPHFCFRAVLCTALLFAMALTGVPGCSSRTTSMNQTALMDFGTRYAAAWSSQNPVS